MQLQMDYIIRSVQYYAQSYQTQAKFSSDANVDITIQQWRQFQKEREQTFKKILTIFEDIKLVDQESKIVRSYRNTINNIIQDGKKGTAMIGFASYIKINRRKSYEGFQKIIRKVVSDCRKQLEKHRKRAKQDQVRQQKKINDQQNQKLLKQKKQSEKDAKDRKKLEQRRRQEEQEYEEKQKISAQRQQQEYRRRKQQEEQFQRQRHQQQKRKQFYEQTNRRFYKQVQQAQKRWQEYQRQLQRRQRMKQTGNRTQLEKMKQEGWTNKELKNFRNQQAILKKQSQNQLHGNEEQSEQVESQFYRFSSTQKHPSIQISNNQTMATFSVFNHGQSKYGFAMLQGRFIDKTGQIRFRIESTGSLVAVGLAIGNIVARNGFQILKQNPNQHGVFLLTQFGKLFAHEDQVHNNTKVDFKYSAGDVIMVSISEDSILWVNENTGIKFQMKFNLSKKKWKKARFCVALYGDQVQQASVSIQGPQDQDDDQESSQKEDSDQESSLREDQDEERLSNQNQDGQLSKGQNTSEKSQDKNDQSEQNSDENGSLNSEEDQNDRNNSERSQNDEDDEIGSNDDDNEEEQEADLGMINWANKVQTKNGQYSFSPTQKNDEIKLEDNNLKAKSNEFSHGLALVEGSVFEKDSYLRLRISSIGYDIGVGFAIRNLITDKNYQMKDKNKVGHGCFLIINSQGQSSYAYCHTGNNVNGNLTHFRITQGDILRVTRNQNQLLWVNETLGDKFKMQLQLTPHQWSQLSFCAYFWPLGKQAQISIVK